MAANNINYQIQTESSTQLNSSSTMYLCGACRHPVDWDTKGVLCENCDNWYHIACQAIPSANYSQLDHSSIIWTCTNCNSNNYSTTSPAMLPTDETATHSESTGSSLELSIDSLDDQKQPIHQSSPTKFKPTAVKSGRSLRFINVNCQSLTGKKGAWINLLHTTKPDVIIATETWLNSTIGNAELECDSYNIYRRDRKSGNHGGVMIAVNSAITSTEVEIKSEAEILWVKIQCVGHRDIYVAACYRPNIADKTSTAPISERPLILCQHQSDQNP